MIIKLRRNAYSLFYFPTIIDFSIKVGLIFQIMPKQATTIATTATTNNLKEQQYNYINKKESPREYSVRTH